MQKRKTDQHENYRPILLRNTLYKISAALIQKRLAKGTDKRQTRYGFREDKSTSDATCRVRMIAEYGETTTINSYLYLYWEKAFDKIDNKNDGSTGEHRGTCKEIWVTKGPYTDTEWIGKTRTGKSKKYELDKDVHYHPTSSK